MDEARILEEKLGGRWCGVAFGENGRHEGRAAKQPLRFCEAVAASSKTTLRLTPDCMVCPGGCRCFGWNGGDAALADALADKAGLDPAVAANLVRTTPRLERPATHVVVGVCSEPQVLVSYAQPETVMDLLRLWQGAHGTPLTVQASGFMSVCGAVAVNAYRNETICVSFGCPDSREHGSIGRDRLVIGLPVKEARALAEQLLKRGQPPGVLQ